MIVQNNAYTDTKIYFKPLFHIFFHQFFIIANIKILTLRCKDKLAKIAYKSCSFFNPAHFMEMFTVDFQLILSIF